MKKKQDSQVQLLKQKQKSDEAAKRLQDEIQSIKAQKVDCCTFSNLEFSIYSFYVLIWILLPGSIATKDKTRGRTISAVEGL